MVAAEWAQKKSLWSPTPPPPTAIDTNSTLANNTAWLATNLLQMYLSKYANGANFLGDNVGISIIFVKVSTVTSNQHENTHGGKGFLLIYSWVCGRRVVKGDDSNVMDHSRATHLTMLPLWHVVLISLSQTIPLLILGLSRQLNYDQQWWILIKDFAEENIRLYKSLFILHLTINLCL